MIFYISSPYSRDKNVYKTQKKCCGKIKKVEYKVDVEEFSRYLYNLSCCSMLETAAHRGPIQLRILGLLIMK